TSSGGAVVGYTTVAFESTTTSGHYTASAPIDARGGFGLALTASQSPHNGDIIRATWSAPGLRSVFCDFTYQYDGGSVYSFAEMGCVVRPVPLPLGHVYPDLLWANSSWISTLYGRGPAIEGYTDASFDYATSSGPQHITVPVVGGRIDKYITGPAPMNGTVIHALFSGPGYSDAQCSFTFQYTGGAVYTFSEMGCVVQAVP